MNTEKLLIAIEKALREADNYALTHLTGKETVSETKMVLNLLKDQIINNPKHLNERILRAMHDVGMSSYKDFENTPLENAIGDVTNILYNELPSYRTLEPLRSDFGKNYPI
jgi:hypothetical protein